MINRVANSRQTLCYVFRPGERGQQQVLLGRKQRGFGTGMIIGLGGKARPGESDAACAVRELHEEAGTVPEWFDVGSVPLDQLWDDEAYWLPRVLAGEMLTGTIVYDDDCRKVARADLKGADLMPRDGAPLTRESLAELLNGAVPLNSYHLFGAHLDDAVVIDHRPDGWVVFYSERGGEFDVRFHDSEDAACRDLLARLRRFSLPARPPSSL
jgi:8-oxo-dGTP pyrophosphatase MutT (NUDIX family)